ncbi:DUF4231 domain-containing protein [Streptomyces melanogenes]|uniref:DUF4231 domain-containing protein n=1 Tax=Streptomyces melanogenes TaxID=67326 RepID=A0ABZ1XIJ3_9ACTN|nr:DUF4231 domain-containing protein [Streptomyces melanogenes]
MAQPVAAAERAVEELLQHDRTILELRHEIRRARMRRFILVSTYSSAPMLLFLLFVGNIATWGRIDLSRINIAGIPILITLLILCPVVRFRSCGDVFDGSVLNEWKAGYAVEKKIDLELAIERKRLSAASIDLPTETRRHIYRETVPGAIEQYRTGGLRYRRVHNAFQSVIIIGSLATSTAASLAETPAPFKWITVGTSFAVGLAAGFTGYFKFRERSFYLQQTADSIEEEYDAVKLKVGRYKGSVDDAAALLEFTERIETLKNDQRKRQQQLDQPTETPEG